MKLPRVDRRRVGGTVYKYHRVTRAPLPADVPEDSDAFIAAWTKQEARSGAPKRITGARGTLAHACGEYLKSGAYRALSPDYARVIRRHIEAICEAYGVAILRQVEARHIKADLSRLDRNPARARRKAWRQLFKLAEANGLVRTDPTGTVPTPAKVKTDGHLPWSQNDIAAFRAYWPHNAPQRLAFELTYWTAARRSDAARLSRRMIGPDGVLTFKQAKTGNPANVPFFCALPHYADTVSHKHLLACLDAQAPDMMLITTRTGAPRSHKAFGSWLSAAARAAGIEGKSPHGLRKSRLTQIAESSGSVHAIMSWGGHVTLSEAQDYIATANRKRAVMGEEQDENPAQSGTVLHKGEKRK